MTRALVGKELREHGWVLLAFLLVDAIGFAVIAITAKDDGSYFVALQRFSWSFGVLGALLINNRLIVREYTARTQLFLETLPVTRRHVLGVKLLLGLVLVVIPVLLALLAASVLARHREPLGLRYLAIVGGRAVAFSVWLYALAFLAGVLGRYRFVFWSGLTLVLFTLAKKLSKQFFELPIFRLLNDQMPFERTHFPWLDFAFSVGIAAACVGVGLALALSWEGALSAQLARKMSHREKAFFFCAGLIWAGVWATLDRHKPRVLFELAQAARASEGSTVVGIATHEGDPTEQTEQLGEHVARDLEGLRCGTCQ